MSTVEASCATVDVRRTTSHLTLFEEVCEQHLDMESLKSMVKKFAGEILPYIEAGKGPSINSLKSLTMYAFDLNKSISEEFFRLREIKGMRKFADVLGDEYMEMSLHMLDFLNEIEHFLMLARKSHSYVNNVIQQYFKMEIDKRDADHYKLILAKLENLNSSGNIYVPSIESMLQKYDVLKSQYDEMLKKLKVEIDELAKKEVTAQNWKHMACMIFIGAVVTVAIVGIVIAGVAAAGVNAPTAATIVGSTIEIIHAIAEAGCVTVSTLNEFEMQYKKIRVAYESRLTETRVAITELGNIRSSITGVKNAIVLMFKPDAAMDQADTDFRMNEMAEDLRTFLNKIEVLEEQVKTCKMEVKKARDAVLVEQKTSQRDRVMLEQKTKKSTCVLL